MTHRLQLPLHQLLCCQGLEILVVAALWLCTIKIHQKHIPQIIEKKHQKNLIGTCIQMPMVHSTKINFQLLDIFLAVSQELLQVFGKCIKNLDSCHGRIFLKMQFFMQKKVLKYLHIWQIFYINIMKKCLTFQRLRKYFKPIFQILKIENYFKKTQQILLKKSL